MLGTCCLRGTCFAVRNIELRPIRQALSGADDLSNFNSATFSGMKPVDTASAMGKFCGVHQRSASRYQAHSRLCPPAVQGFVSYSAQSSKAAVSNWSVQQRLAGRQMTLPSLGKPTF